MANYAKGNVGPHVLLEMDEAASDVTRGIVALSDVAAQAGVNKLTGQLVWVCVVSPVRLSRPEAQGSAFARPAGGRGVVVGPILNQWTSDVFCDNENGRNFLFKNNGDGAFVDVAQQAGDNNTIRLRLTFLNGSISQLCDHVKVWLTSTSMAEEWRWPTSTAMGRQTSSTATGTGPTDCSCRAASLASG